MTGQPSSEHHDAPNVGLTYLERLGAGDLEFFKAFDQSADEAIRAASRELPAEVYQELRSGLLSGLTSVIGGGRLTVTLVIDSNILVADAFRVASGKPSSTDRLLASPFVRLVAPSDIVEEARTQVVEDLPKKASLEKAREHVEHLLSRVQVVENLPSIALESARQRLADRDTEDAPFLAMLIEAEGEGIISRDKEAFESLEGVKRWELREFADLVTAYESGTLALAIGAATTEAALELMAAVGNAVLAALMEAFSVFAGVVTALVKGTADALSRVPAWAWAVLAAVGGAVLVGAIFSKEFREWLLEGLSSIGDILLKAASTIIDAAKTIVRALHDLLVWLWDILGPAIIAAGKGAIVAIGVLLRRITLLIEECTKVVDGRS